MRTGWSRQAILELTAIRNQKGENYAKDIQDVCNSTAQILGYDVVTIIHFHAVHTLIKTLRGG